MFKRLFIPLTAVVLTILTPPTKALGLIPCGENRHDAERGKYWGCWEETSTETKIFMPEIPTPPTPIKREEVEPCLKKDSWTNNCGFVDPQGNIEFFRKQLKVLGETMVMDATNTKSTLEYQKLTQWMVNQVAKVIGNWKWNAHNQMNYDHKQMVMSSLGLKLFNQQKKQNRDELFERLGNQGAMLIYFSREDCSYCHIMTSKYQKTALLSKLKLANLSILGDCLIEDRTLCSKDDKAKSIATMVGVDITPSLYVFIPQSQEEKSALKGNFIKVSLGVESSDLILNRLSLFLNKAEAVGFKTLKDISHNYENFTIQNQ